MRECISKVRVVFAQIVGNLDVRALSQDPLAAIADSAAPVLA